jgi:hypothetical protein
MRTPACRSLVADTGEVSRALEARYRSPGKHRARWSTHLAPPWPSHTADPWGGEGAWGRKGDVDNSTTASPSPSLSPPPHPHTYSHPTLHPSRTTQDPARWSRTHEGDRGHELCVLSNLTAQVWHNDDAVFIGVERRLLAGLAKLGHTGESGSGRGSEGASGGWSITGGSQPQTQSTQTTRPSQS